MLKKIKKVNLKGCTLGLNIRRHRLVQLKLADIRPVCRLASFFLRSLTEKVLLICIWSALSAAMSSVGNQLWSLAASHSDVLFEWFCSLLGPVMCPRRLWAKRGPDCLVDRSWSGIGHLSKLATRSPPIQKKCPKVKGGGGRRRKAELSFLGDVLL